MFLMASAHTTNPTRAVGLEKLLVILSRAIR